MEAASELLSAIYAIDQEKSINKNTQLNADQFGYRSLHFVISFNSDRANLPENVKFRGLKAEIQVRTILQHAWAAIDWKLRYKSVLEAPQEIRRRVFRVSALLELADDEFSYLSRTASDLRSSYREKIDAGNYKIELNRDSLELFLESDEKLGKIVEMVSLINYSIAPYPPDARNPYGNFLAMLQFLKIYDIDSLRASISPIATDDKGQFSDIFRKWNNGKKPPKLMMSKAGMARLSIILALENKKALEILELFPFGEKLQKAILEVLDVEHA